MRGLPRGFTIVELLIVIVVIGILSVIAVSAFRGSQERARTATVQSDLKNAAKSLEVENTDTGNYPASAANLTKSDATTYQYAYTASTNSYCLTATNGTISYKITNSNKTPVVGGCPGHGTGGVAAITNLHPNPRLYTSNSVGYSNQTPANGTISITGGTGPAGETTYNVTTTTAGQLRIAMYAAPLAARTVSPGEQYTVSFDLYSSIGIAGPSLEVGFNSAWQSFALTPVGIASGWSRYSATFTVPTGATNFQTVQLITPASPGVPSGTSFRLTKTMLTASSGTPAYADGNTANWIWNGTANNSTSTGPAL